jgi:hypothetical protein
MSKSDVLRIGPGLAEIRAALRSGDARIHIGQSFSLRTGEWFWTAQVMDGRKKVGRPMLSGEGTFSELMALLGELIESPDDRIQVAGEDKS